MVAEIAATEISTVARQGGARGSLAALIPPSRGPAIDHSWGERQARAVRVTTAALGLGAAVACATAPQREVVPQREVAAPEREVGVPVVRPTEVSSPAPERGPDAIAGLAARGVFHDDFARGVLYTWTTAEQVAALRERPRLLVAEAGVGVLSPFLRALTAIVAGRGAGHELAAVLLEHPALRRRRYAWTSPFATTMGLGPVRYGDALVRVELDPRALLLRFRPQDREPFAAVDLQGVAVPVGELLAAPERLGAVYHVRDGPRDEVPFREYVLCNEAMIAAWSVATPEIRAQVDADTELVNALAVGPLAALPDAALRSSAAPAWASARAGATPIDRWQASLAFDNQRYRPSAANLRDIVATLRDYDGSGAPLTVRPDHPAQASR